MCARSAGDRSKVMGYKSSELKAEGKEARGYGAARGGRGNSVVFNGKL